VTRRTTICCSAVALILLGPAARAGSDSARKHEPFALVPARRVWTLALRTPLALAPSYDETRAYFPLEQNRLAAYEIVSGTQSWLVEARPLFPPTTGSGFVFVVEADAVRALSAGDGSVAWTRAMPQPFAVRPVWDNGWLVGVTASGRVVALRATDGEPIWERDIGSAAHAPVALAADRVYVPTAGRIVALAIADGTPVWERRIGGLPNEILARDTRLYVGSTDNFFYCLMTRDGRIDWRWRTGADVIGMPAADEDRVFFVSLDNVMRALDLTSGGQHWMRALPVRPIAGPLLAGATLVIAGQTAALKTFNARDGAPAADISAGDEVASPPHLVPGMLPSILFAVKSLARGASAVLFQRGIEPESTPPGPLPNPVKPAPALPTP
jgi:outer membrane protein assembly factor BamB